MTIRKTEYYTVTCDQCTEELDLMGEGGFTVFKTEANAKAAASENEWEVADNGKVTCCGCIVEGAEELAAEGGG